MGYEKDRRWSDQYIPAIKAIVGPYLLTTAPFEWDTKQATDLIVIHARDKTIAARMRRARFAKQYPYEFTIRYQRDTGVSTEYEKIINGWADWMFYGFAADGDADGLIQRWWLLDLNVFRACLIRRRGDNKLAVEKPNNDGTSLLAFNVGKFPRTIIIGSEPPRSLRDDEEQIRREDLQLALDDA